MKTLSFSNSDKIPVMGLGTWLSKKNEVYNAVLDAINTGYRHIDCAYIYGNEAEVGEALKEAFSSRLVRREDMFITSKLWNSDHASKDVEPAIKTTLKNLQLEYLDLYLMHWPIANRPGRETASSTADLVSLNEIPLSETWEAMQALKTKSLTRHIGVSNFSIVKIKELIEKTGINPEMNQVELHPYFQQNELVDYCKQNNILVTAYSPLGSSRTVGTEKGLDKENIILDIAKKHNCSPAQILLAWGIERGTIVIPKSVHAQRIKDNFESLNVQLDKDDMSVIAALDKNSRLSKGTFAVFPDGPYTLKNIWDE